VTSPPTAHELAIDAHELTKRYNGRAVVDHLSIRVERGLIFGFLGPNGSGKTTTIRMLCGLLTADEGEGTCLGHDLRTEAAAVKREVGYMTQRFSLYEDLSIAENLDFVARMYGVAGRKRAIETTLERLGLAARRAQLAGLTALHGHGGTPGLAPAPRPRRRHRTSAASTTSRGRRGLSTGWGRSVPPARGA